MNTIRICPICGSDSPVENPDAIAVCENCGNDLPEKAPERLIYDELTDIPESLNGKIFAVGVISPISIILVAFGVLILLTALCH